MYLFSLLHVSCDLGFINNDRKHAFPAIFILVFFVTSLFDGRSAQIRVTMHAESQ